MLVVIDRCSEFPTIIDFSFSTVGDMTLDDNTYKVIILTNDNKTKLAILFKSYDLLYLTMNKLMAGETIDLNSILDPKDLLEHPENINHFYIYLDNNDEIISIDKDDLSYWLQVLKFETIKSEGN